MSSTITTLTIQLIQHPNKEQENTLKFNIDQADRISYEVAINALIMCADHLIQEKIKQNEQNNLQLEQTENSTTKEK